MELSSDNIEELAKVLSSDASHQGDVFQMKSVFSSVDVDRVISEAQDSLLKTSMEVIASSGVPCSFNDILDDICKMDSKIELQQAASCNPPADSNQQKLPLETTPAFYHMPDLDMQPTDFTPECSFSNPPDFLQPLGQWSEYLPLPPSALSTIQDIPQLAPIPPSKPPTPPPEPVIQETPTISFESIQPTIDNQWRVQEEKRMEPQIPTTPMQYFNNYQYTIPPAMLNCHQIQHEEVPNTNMQFTPIPEVNMNFMLFPQQPVGPQFRSHPVQQPPQFLDWARVIPRRALIQPSEIVVLRPLRTRKVMSSRQNFDLASYFDTSSITIPMIRERPRPRNQRRKQKLYTIPRADNLMFDFELEVEKDTNNNSNNNEEQLYPETEIPELDEIFKRKRRTLNARRNPPEQEVCIKIPIPNHSPIEVPNEQKDEIFPPDIKELEESFSDVDSDDAPLTAIKSMKCINCGKLFKTYRSLTIHSKRCKVVRQSPDLSKEVSQEPVKAPKIVRKLETQQTSNCTNTNKKDVNLKIVSPVERPLTRSQTRKALKRKATNVDSEDVGAQKLSK